MKDLISMRDELFNYRAHINDDWNEWSSLIKKLDKETRDAEAQAYKDFKATNDISNVLTDAANRITKLNKSINKHEKDQKLLARSIASHAPLVVAPALAAAVATSTNMKVPKRPALEFSGKPEEWANFWKCFNRSVHTNTSILTVDKFYYLNMYLKPPASDVIAGIPIDDANYAVAISRLAKKFGRTDKVIDRLYQKFFDLKIEHKSDEVQKLATEFEIICGLLEGQGVDILNDRSLQHSVLTKLPKQISAKLHEAKAIALEAPGGTWTTQDFRDKLEQIVEIDEDTEESYSCLHNKEQKIKNFKTKGGSNPSNVFAITDGKKSESNVQRCKLCSKSHNTYYCDTYSSPKERYERVCELKLCTIA